MQICDVKFLSGLPSFLFFNEHHKSWSLQDTCTIFLITNAKHNYNQNIIASICLYRC